MENNLNIEAKQIVDSLPEGVLDELTNESEKVRKKATKLISGNIDIAGEEGQELIKDIVLYMSKIGFTDSALSFLAVLIGNGNFINMSTISDIYDVAVDDITFALEDNDTEFFDSLTNKIDMLFSRSHKSHLYKDNLEYVLLLGKEFERKGDYYKALELYNDLIGKGEPIGYLKAAHVYKELKMYDFAISLLENAYDFYGDKVFLENIIITYCETGNLQEAKKVYMKLYSSTKNGENVLPFFVYSFIIEEDTDLEKYEFMMVNYLNENYLTPLPVFKKLSLIVQNYIDSNLEYIKLCLKKYKNKDLETLSTEEYLDFKMLLKRKLFLLQIGVTILKDEKYLKEHLQDLEFLGLSNNQLKIDILAEHFDENLSLVVKEEFGLSQLNSDLDSDDGENEDNELDLNTKELLSVYVAKLSMIYFNGANYVVLKKLFALLEESYKQIGDIDESEIANSLKILKNEADYIDSFSPELGYQYKRFLSEIDELYGKFHRVTIQKIARDTEKYKNESDYPKIIFENPKIALLFFIEKIVSQNFEEIEHGEFGDFLEKYDLELNNEEDLVLFAMLIYDLSFDNAIDFIINNDELSNNTIAIYYLLLSIVNGDDDLINPTLKDLNSHYKEKYGSRGFISYVKLFLSKREKEEITDIERGYIKLCYANLGILQGKGADYIINNLLEAEEIDNLEATMLLGDMLEYNGYFDESISRFECAYNINPNINTLSKLISALLNKGDYEKSLKYIDLGIKLKYEMSYYLFSYHLYIGNYKAAFLSFSQVVNNDQPFIDVPLGTNQKFIDVCNRILSIDSEISINTYELKLFASYAKYRLDLTFENGNTYEVSYKYYLNLFNILGSIPLENLPDFIKETIYKFCNAEDELSDLGVDIFNLDLQQSLIVIDFYLNDLKQFLLQFSKSIQTLEEYENLRKFINKFCSMACVYFSQINGAEEYAYKWRTELNFIPVPDAILIDEEDFGSKLVN